MHGQLSLAFTTLTIFLVDCADFPNQQYDHVDKGWQLFVTPTSQLIQHNVATPYNVYVSSCHILFTT